jgi:hypothetical protein
MSWCVFPAAKAIAFALPGIITTCWQSGKPRAGKREKSTQDTLTNNGFMLKYNGANSMKSSYDLSDESLMA